MDIGFVWDEMKYQTVLEQHNVNFTKSPPLWMTPPDTKRRDWLSTKTAGFG